MSLKIHVLTPGYLPRRHLKKRKPRLWELCSKCSVGGSYGADSMSLCFWYMDIVSNYVNNVYIYIYMSILFIDLYRLCIYITHLHTITRFLLDVFFTWPYWRYIRTYVMAQWWPLRNALPSSRPKKHDDRCWSIPGRCSPSKQRLNLGNQGEHLPTRSDN